MDLQTLKSDKTLTVRELAEIFHVTPPTVRRWAKQHAIPAFRTPSGHFRYRLSDVLKYLCGIEEQESTNVGYRT